MSRRPDHDPARCGCERHRNARLIIDTLLSEHPELATIDEVLAYIERKLGER